MSDYRDRSLAFVRRVKGLPPRYSSARQAMEASSVNSGAPAAPGVIVWFEGGRWGDCGIALDADHALVLDSHGQPRLTALTGHSSPYVGWSEGIGS
jgi:hypothetical protein